MLNASQDPVQQVLPGSVPGKVVKAGCLGCSHAVCDEWVQT